MLGFRVEPRIRDERNDIAQGSHLVVVRENSGGHRLRVTLSDDHCVNRRNTEVDHAEGSVARRRYNQLLLHMRAAKFSRNVSDRHSIGRDASTGG